MRTLSPEQVESLENKIPNESGTPLTVIEEGMWYKGKDEIINPNVHPIQKKASAEMETSKMNTVSIIEKKRKGQQLTDNEIIWTIKAYTNGEIPDYQMSALAMAIFFKGMTKRETAALTAAMRDSGSVFQWPDGTPPKVDKHSTGGIGDKVSLILAPLLACDELWVPMISGRGLGITGGTLDKLESIPGFNVNLSAEQGLMQLDKIGVFMAGQTNDFCPADKKLYALRDVTATVPSQPLLISSIMCKKLAESLDRLVLDVKYGSGAFMKTKKHAKELALGLVDAGNSNGVKTSHLLTETNEPLGHAVGNALEVIEAIEVLQGKGSNDLVALTLDLAAKVSNCTRDELNVKLQNGQAWEKFVAMVQAQGGDASALDKLGKIHKAPCIRTLVAEKSGTISQMDAESIGYASVLLGAGRLKTSDQINFAVGFSEIKKVGEHVEKGEHLMSIHATSEADVLTAAKQIKVKIV